ncbi:MAG: hypothetical protein IPG61_09635 [bacterium]|nr:hypothetical protein [bacterium]
MDGQVPLDIWKVAGERFLFCRGSLRVGVGAGFGVAHLAASADFTNAAGYTRSGSADAVTALLDAQLTLDCSVLRNLSIVAALGARPRRSTKSESATRRFSGIQTAVWS